MQEWKCQVQFYSEAEHVLPHRRIRADRYKFICYYLPPEAFKMFDLQNDPHELNNLYPDPQYSPMAKQLRARLDELRQKLVTPGNTISTKPISMCAQREDPPTRAMHDSALIKVLCGPH